MRGTLRRRARALLCLLVGLGAALVMGAGPHDAAATFRSGHVDPAGPASDAAQTAVTALTRSVGVVRTPGRISRPVQAGNPGHHRARPHPVAPSPLDTTVPHGLQLHAGTAATGPAAAASSAAARTAPAAAIRGPPTGDGP